jgi:hypothetical protein
MAQQRADLQKMLVGILGSDKVYFQPPPNAQMQYPCIVYKRDALAQDHADSFPYKYRVRYQVIVVDTEPDSDILKKFYELPLCSFERFYTADNLNHDVFNLYF